MLLTDKCVFLFPHYYTKTEYLMFPAHVDTDTCILDTDTCICILR